MKKVLLLILLLSLPVSAYYHHDSSIDWKEYSPESFELAEKENKPVFMLITAVWCYWCHVYRDETLHDSEVVNYINENFVPVFVDADKRQDLTRQYLAGGWPSTVFFSPSGEEVNSINGMIRKDDLMGYMQKVVSFFESGQKISKEDLEKGIITKSSVSQKELEDLWDNAPLSLLSSFDKEFGGIGSQRKFPMGRVYEFFLYRYAKTREPVLLEATELSLNNMAPVDWIDFSKPIDERVLRGVYDPVEGGFFRYNVNRDWSVPHYEKMLDSNAYIIRAYLLAYNVTRNERYRALAEHGLFYVMSQLQDVSGRLYGSQDAGHEEYYRQTKEERAQGLFESSPRIDNTTYADWSGAMISSFFVAASVLDNQSYADAGLNAAQFVKDNMIGEGVLHFYDGESQLNGLLLDNAEIASAFLDVFSFTGDFSYLESAEQILEFSNQRLYNGSAGVYYERNSSDTHLYGRNDAFLPLFPVEGNTAMVLALTKAYEATGKQIYLDRARSVMGFLVDTDSGLESLAVQAMVADKLMGEVSLDFERETVSASFFILLFVSFIAGLLSFLSPCTLPLLPAYAVHTMKSKNAVRCTLAFFLGLALIFSILGISIALVGKILTKAVPQISMFAGAIIILFGVFTIIGKGFGGFHLKRLQDGAFGSFLFGASYGVAWTPCVGPILGAIFVLAATTGTWIKGGVLLFAYALGIAIPLLILSYYVDKLRHKGKVWTFLRGREITIRIFKWKAHTHTTNLIAGALLIIIGYLIFSGTLYSINSIAIETPLQQKIFSLEDVLMGFLR